MLSAVTGSWSPTPTSFSYVWKRNGKAISKATSSSYKLTSADAGTSTTVTVTAIRSGSLTTAKTSASLVIDKLVTKAPTPTVAGTAAVGKTLTATAGKWSPSGVGLAYQWKRNGVAIDFATSKTYLLTTDDAGTKVTVSVTGTKSGYTSVTKTSSSKTIQKLLTATPTPTISGNITKGSKLVVTAGTWTPAPVKLTYQWYRNGAAIKGATKTSYTLGSKDVGAIMTVKVTGSKSGYTTVAEVSAAFPSP